MSYEETRKSTVILEHLRGMEVRPIKRDERSYWDELIRQHHYLGLHSLIGETIRYIAIYQGQWFALIGWSAAVFKCKVRDQWIGWHPFIQYKRLFFIANNSRFFDLARCLYTEPCFSCSCTEPQTIVPGLANALWSSHLPCRNIC